jgi:hypothetical protein
VCQYHTKKTLPSAKSKLGSVLFLNNLLRFIADYAIVVSIEDFFVELIIDKVSGSNSPEKKASNMF